MKRSLSVIGQTLLFLLIFLAGTLWDPFNLKWFITHPTLTSTRYFVPDGMILMFAVYVVVLGIEAARKRLLNSGPWSTLAIVLALVVGLLSKFGFATHELF